MKKKPKYRQCFLSKKLPSGEIRQTSYIPEKYAVEGAVLKLLRADGIWDNGWVVVFAGEDLIDEPIYWKEAIRVHRDNTGDSLPKSQEK